MRDIYPTKLKTRHWPQVVFFTVLDVAAVNAFLIWMATHPNWQSNQAARRRRMFIKDISMALVRPHIKRRPTHGMHAATANAIGIALQRPPVQQPPRVLAPQGWKLCTLCLQQSYGDGYTEARKKGNKSKNTCNKCNEVVCGKHSTKTVVFTCHGCA
mgnify:CR=1 FL=1